MVLITSCDLPMDLLADWISLWEPWTDASRDPKSIGAGMHSKWMGALSCGSHFFGWFLSSARTGRAVHAFNRV